MSIVQSFVHFLSSWCIPSIRDWKRKCSPYSQRRQIRKQLLKFYREVCTQCYGMNKESFSMNVMLQVTLERCWGIFQKAKESGHSGHRTQRVQVPLFSVAEKTMYMLGDSSKEESWQSWRDQIMMPWEHSNYTGFYPVDKQAIRGFTVPERNVRIHV